MALPSTHRGDQGAGRPSAPRGSGGDSPMNSLGLRTDSMIACLDRLDSVAPAPAADPSSEEWREALAPAFARHPEEEGEEVGEEELDDEEDLDEDLDDDEEGFDE